MSRFLFIANNLALDFSNTLVVDSEGHSVDLVGSLDDLIDWARETEIISQRQAAKVLKDIGKELASSILQKAFELRGALRSTALALANGKVVPKAAIDRINSVLAEKDGHFEIVRTSDGYKSKLNIGYEDVRDLMLPVAESAMRLICYADPSLVKKCANAECVLFFYDTSKRHGRKWCSMSICGNRSKAAAFYDRNRSSIR